MELALFLRHQAGGDRWRLWPEPEDIPPGTVRETGYYILELEGPGARDAELSVDDAPLEALRSGQDRARWRWSPGFQAGEVEFQLRAETTRRRIRVVTDADLRKLTRDDFDAMVREILEDTLALLSLSSFRRAISRGTGGPLPPIARLEFLRSRVDELESVIATIRRAPRRRLQAEDAVVPWHRARHATGAEIVRSLRHGRVLQESRERPRLPAALRGHLPERVRTRRRTDTFDLPEHREMAACLRSWRDWLQTMSGRLAVAAMPNGVGAGWAAHAQALARRLDRLRLGEPFEGLPDVPATLTTTALFRNDSAYRAFHRLWRDMNLGMASIFGDFLKLPLGRTFDLYELWCFLRLARAAAERWGLEGAGPAELFEASGATLTIASASATMTAGDGWRLAFQKRFAEFWASPDGRGSYSRPMTPDIVVWREIDGKPGALVVLDAKYRVEEGLSDALTSAHTYRDSIVDIADGQIRSAISGAYLLTPQRAGSHGPYRELPMPDRLFSASYREAFRFGAVSLRPGMSASELATALNAASRAAES